jgi:hypothetical protein
MNCEGYRVEVATGQVFPNKSLLYQAPVEVVHIDHIYPEHEGQLLISPPSNEIKTLGEAIYKMMKWRREWIVVRQVLSAPITSKPPPPGFAKSLLVPNVSPSLYDKVNGCTVKYTSPMALV